MNDKSALVQYEMRDDVGYLKLTAPVLNVLSGQMMEDITAILEEAANDESLKALAVTADGKAFSAGADVGDGATAPSDPWSAFSGASAASWSRASWPES